MRMTTTILMVSAMLLFFSAGSVQAQNAAKAADCSTYAQNRSNAEASTGAGALGGAARGAARGALFGAIIDGGKGAKRGAGAGAGFGALGGAVRTNQDRQALYQHYFNICMNS